MNYRRCGRSGLLLPEISLGLWHNFGGVDDFENAREMAWKAFDLGITHFDLANNYGPPPGSAEENFGRILRAGLSSHRDELIISTKAGHRMWDGPYGEWGSRKYMLASLDQSLKRMGLDYVDIFYSHRPDPETPIEETAMALVDAVRRGKALYAGISNYAPDKTKQVAQILRGEGISLLIHQPSYSMLNRKIEETGLLDALEEVGVGCIVFSPLAQGILTGKYLGGMPTDSRAAKPHGFLKPEHVTPEKIAKVQKLADLASKRGQSMAQLAITWVLRHEGMTSALIGASRASQVEEIVESIHQPRLSADECRAIETILSE